MCMTKSRLDDNHDRPTLNIPHPKRGMHVATLPESRPETAGAGVVPSGAHWRS